MPCWTIHLGVATILNKDLKLNKDKFLFGSVIPDVTKENPFGRKYAHYFGTKTHDKCNEEVVDIDKFLEDYKDKMDYDLIIGYYVHLLTDIYYNDQVYSNSFVTDKEKEVIGIRDKEGNIFVPEENTHDVRRKIKQSDFINYGKYLLEQGLLEIPENVEVVKEELQLLKEHFVEYEEAKERIEYFKTDDFIEFNTGYDEEAFKLFTKEEYDKIFDDCIAFCKRKIKK